jgi:deoxycytidine triphosphate deaminase/DNA-binding XRE family transcriptional regulator
MATGARQANDDEPAMSPREHLKLQMLRHGLSAPKLAEDLGVHSQTLYNVTSGTRQISSKLAKKLADRFGEPVEFWLGERLSPPGEEASACPPGALVDKDLRSLVNRPESGLGISPFIEGNVAPASYDLTIGLIVTRGFSMIDKYGWGLIVKFLYDDASLRDDERREAKDLVNTYDGDIGYIKPGDPFTLPPNQAVGIVMREELRFSGDFLARVGATTSKAISGLMISHGLQVDPGYSGPILVSAFNMGLPGKNDELEKIELRAGQRALSLEIIRLRHSPEDTYHESTNIARIVERLGIEIAELFDYEEIPKEHRYKVALLADRDVSFIFDGELAEVRSQTVARIVENLARGEGFDALIQPFTKALGQVTIDEADALALVERFPACKKEAKALAAASFHGGRERRTLEETLKRLDLPPVTAVAKLMGVKVAAPPR